MRWWRFLPFYECSPWDVVQGQVQNVFYPPSSRWGWPARRPVSAAPTSPTRSRPGVRIPSIRSWWCMRSVAFRMYVVMAYLDNLIAWGDSLFAQNTREAINEATQIYIFANDILFGQAGPDSPTGRDARLHLQRSQDPLRDRCVLECAGADGERLPVPDSHGLGIDRGDGACPGDVNAVPYF